MAKKSRERPATDDPVARRRGEVVRRAREERGLTQRALATRVPMNNAYLGRIEKGESKRLGARIARGLADGLGLPLTALMPKETVQPDEETGRAPSAARSPARLAQALLNQLAALVIVPVVSSTRGAAAPGRVGRA